MTAGALLGAVQMVVFMIPAEVVPGGFSSLAMILNDLIGTPVGVVVLLLNIPIQVVAWRMLRSWQVVVRTVYVVTVFSLAVDGLTLIDTGPVSDDRLLNALFGGAVGGISSGLVFRGGSTYGGTSTIARIIQRRSGTPMSTTFLYTDAGLIALAGLVYGWEAVLYAVISLVLGGLAADYVMEGPAVIRTVFIITDQPVVVSQHIIATFNRTVTRWDAEGMYTRGTHAVLFVAVPRSDAGWIRQEILAVDPAAFVVIAQGHTAYGSSFRRVRAAGDAHRTGQPEGR